MAESSTSMIIGNDFVAEHQEEENEILYNVSSNRQKPVEETLEMREEDRISALPDSLLIHILSLLCSCASSVGESIKTGTLSKRWQYLWTAVPILIFDDTVLFSISEEKESSKPEFVSSVNRTLILRGHNKLKEFDVSTYNYSAAYQPHFNVWIRYAVVCKVEELFITTFSDEVYKLYELPVHLFRNSCLTKLYLDYCILEPIGEINWKNLKSLRIGHECITQKLISNILSGSPSLEYLELYNCEVSGFDVLNFTSTSLKKLVVSGYGGIDGDDVKALKIRAHNILCLEIRGDMLMAKEVIWLDVPSLVEAYLNYWWQPCFADECITADETEEELLKKFIKSLQHVNELKCGSMCLKVLSRLKAKGFTCPPNMTFHVTE